MQAPTAGNEPRLNGELLNAYTGHVVRMVGRVLSYDGGANAVIQSCDDRQVTVHCQSSGKFQVGMAVEVVGLVNADASIQENDTYSFGNADDFRKCR